MTDTLPRVTLTTDGSARGNPGPGGWAALLETPDGRERLLHGEVPLPTTNNAMEVAAVARALQALKQPCHVHLRCDSQYVLNGLRRILNGGTMASTKFNQGLWAELEAAVGRHELELEWVRGHNGDARNERVDLAANAAANAAAATFQGPVAPAAAGGWTIALRSADRGQRARWLFQSPTVERQGEEVQRGATELTTLYHALLAALQAAASAPGAAEAELTVLSNLETLIKQGRGEWQVKQPAQQPLAAATMPLRARFAAVHFRHLPTAELQQHFAAADIAV